MKVNLGCGPQIPAGWLNVDYALGARLARVPLLRPLLRRLGLFGLDWDPSIFIHDITKPFPWADASVEVVYSSHTLEHLTREQGQFVMAEAHRVLKPGGIIRIVVPDLDHFVQRYLDKKFKADRFMEELGVLYSPYPSALKTLLAPFIQFPHKCMYDTDSMVALMTRTGFRAAPRRPFESAIADIGAIEMAERTAEAVIVEGIR